MSVFTAACFCLGLWFESTCKYVSACDQGQNSSASCPSLTVSVGEHFSDGTGNAEAPLYHGSKQQTYCPHLCQHFGLSSCIATSVNISPIWVKTACTDTMVNGETHQDVVRPHSSVLQLLNKLHRIPHVSNSLMYRRRSPVRWFAKVGGLIVLTIV